jgi:hypothetical protein
LGQTGWIGAFCSKKSTDKFFRFKRGQNALGGRFRTSFVDRNRNYENTPNMSFGSNGVDRVRSFQKHQHEFFRFIRGQNCPRGRDSHEVCRPKPKLRKHTKHEFWVKRGGLGAFVMKKSTASFFAPQMARTTLGAGFARGLSTETETAKTHQTRVLGPTGWIGCVHCGKINYKFFRFNHGQNSPRGRFRTSFVDSKPKLRKCTRHEFWVKWGGLGAIVSKKINCKFFCLNRGQNNPSGQLSHEFCRAKTKQRKRTKHEFWVKRGGFGAFVSKNSTASFFRFKVARTALGGGFGTSFVDRNRNYENTPNMSFCVKRVDWVRSFQKNQLQAFSLHKWPER